MLSLQLINASDFFCQKQGHYALYSDRAVCAGAPLIEPSIPWNRLLAGDFWRDLYSPFACVVHDTTTQTVTLVRDHIGIAPLYYHQQANRVIFGNTLPDVLRQLNSTPKFNQQELTYLFTEQLRYSDETLYQGIKRVEPGHYVRIAPNKLPTKHAYWQLALEGEPLIYKTDGEYVAHFDHLMQESIRHATQGHHRIAVEYSAGIDSTAVYVGCTSQQLEPELFMSEVQANKAEKYDTNRQYEEATLAQLKPEHLHRIRDEGFEPLSVLQQYSQWFAGAPPYVFDVFAHNVHRAVARQGHTLLLSGFGGDQGVSGHVPYAFFVPELIRQEGLSCARQYVQPRGLKGELALRSHAHPYFYQLMHGIQYLSNTLRASAQRDYYVPYFSTLRVAECALLQGDLSREIRLRIEASSIVSRQFGFEYRYPLLYPKLLEFYVSIPLAQKRKNTKGRFLIRRYLERYVPNAGFSQYQKSEGLPIAPATLAHYLQQCSQGRYEPTFQGISYPSEHKTTDVKQHRLRQALAYMLDYHQMHRT